MKPIIIGKLDIDNKITKQHVTHKKSKTADAYGNPDNDFSVNCMISRKKALELQENLGYHPAGYSFYNFKATPEKTTWSCYGSCD